MRRRLDIELVRRGLAGSRTAAQALIASGRVLVGGALADKPARLVAAGEPLSLTGPPPRFVSRGGDKLAAALDAFGVGAGGRRALDAGASTGGFTDCLLQGGAASVVALDVGHGQLHERLRADPRVIVRERTNLRDARPEAVGGPFDVVTADLSFISLRTVMSELLALLDPAGDAVWLLKPQFEAGRAEASRGEGVIRDPAVWLRVLTEVWSDLEARGAAMMGVMVSPVLGAAGNVEFLLHVRHGGRGVGEPALGTAVSAARRLTSAQESESSPEDQDCE